MESQHLSTNVYSFKYFNSSSRFYNRAKCLHKVFVSILRSLCKEDTIKKEIQNSLTVFTGHQDIDLRDSSIKNDPEGPNSTNM